MLANEVNLVDFELLIRISTLPTWFVPRESLWMLHLIPHPSLQIPKKQRSDECPRKEISPSHTTENLGSLPTFNSDLFQKPNRACIIPKHDCPHRRSTFKVSGKNHVRSLRARAPF
jgi:hypothetical protein